VASLTIRNIPEEAKLRFRQVAAAHGRSMEEHLRQMVLSAGGVFVATEPKGVSDMARSFQHFEPDPKAKSRARIEHLIALGRGVDWEPPKREVGTIKETDFS
jgi:plasmid stability protein